MTNVAQAHERDPGHRPFELVRTAKASSTTGHRSPRSARSASASPDTSRKLNHDRLADRDVVAQFVIVHPNSTRAAVPAVGTARPAGPAVQGRRTWPRALRQRTAIRSTTGRSKSRCWKGVRVCSCMRRGTAVDSSWIADVSSIPGSCSPPPAAGMWCPGRTVEQANRCGRSRVDSGCGPCHQPLPWLVEATRQLRAGATRVRAGTRGPMDAVVRPVPGDGRPGCPERA